MTARMRSAVLSSGQTARSALISLAPGDSDAIAEGRVFADRRRIVNADQWLDTGVSVTWYASRNVSGGASCDRAHPEGGDEPGTLPDSTVPRILATRDGVIALYKPAAFSSEPDKTGNQACVTEFLKQAFSGKLEPQEVHIATRLDVGVSGLVLVATSRESKQHLSALSEQGKLHRTYVAVCAGAVAKEGIWRGSVETTQQKKGRPAVTRFSRLSQLDLQASVNASGKTPLTQLSLVRFQPETGRKHQLRIHAARNGYPLLGDRRYGGPKQLVLPNGTVRTLPRILLQAVTTEVPLGSGDTWRIDCPVDEEVQVLWLQFGGSYADFQPI